MALNLSQYIAPFTPSRPASGTGTRVAGELRNQKEQKLRDERYYAGLDHDVAMQDDRQAEAMRHRGLDEIDRFRQDVAEGRYGSAQSRLPILQEYGWNVAEFPGMGGISNYQFSYAGMSPVDAAIQQQAATANPAAEAGQAAGMAGYQAMQQAGPPQSFEEQLIEQGTQAVGSDADFRANAELAGYLDSQETPARGGETVPIATTPEQAVEMARKRKGLPALGAVGMHSDNARPTNIPWQVSPGAMGSEAAQGDKTALDSYFEQMAEQEMTEQTAPEAEAATFPTSPPSTSPLPATSSMQTGSPVGRALETDRIEELKADRIREFAKHVESGAFGPRVAEWSRGLQKSNLSFENYYKKLMDMVNRESVERAAAARRPPVTTFRYTDKRGTKRDASKEFKDYWKSEAKEVVDSVRSGQEALTNIRDKNYIQDALAVRKMIKASGDQRPSDNDISGMTAGSQRSAFMKVWDTAVSNVERSRSLNSQQRQAYIHGLKNLIRYNRTLAQDRYERARQYYLESEMQSEKDQIGRLIRLYFPKEYWEADKALEAPAYSGEALKTTEPGETEELRPRGKMSEADKAILKALEELD